MLKKFLNLTTSFQKTFQKKQRAEEYRRLKRRYIIAQITRAIIAVVVLLGALWGINILFEEPIGRILEHLHTHKVTIYLGFLGSEIIFGVLPPDLFILALPKTPIEYIGGLVILAWISQSISFFHYFIGCRLSNTAFYAKTLGRRFRRELRQLKRFGGLLIVLSALTPISFSIICLLVGATKYPLRHFALFGLSRILRFVLYGYLLWSVMG